MSVGAAAIERFPALVGVPPRHAPVLEKQYGDPKFEDKKKDADKYAIERRVKAENWRRFGDGAKDFAVKSLLGGGAVLLADQYLHDFISDPVRDQILNIGTLAVGASTAAAIGSKVGAEFIAAPDADVDKIAVQSMKLNRAGGMQLAAKIGKNAAWLAKMGLIGVAGVAAGEGIAQAIGYNLGDVLQTVDGFIPDTHVLEPIVEGAARISPDITPDMVYPAAGLAVGAEMLRRNFKKQDEVYEAATRFMQADPTADKKSSETEILGNSKKSLKGNLDKMISAKLWTGDVMGSLFWYIQNLKLKFEGRKGPGVATLPEIVRNRNRGWENIIINFKKYQSVPLIAAGVLGLMAPDLDGPLSQMITNQHIAPAVWSGLALGGAAKYKFFDEPAAAYLDSVRKSLDFGLSSGREKHRVKTVV